MAKDRIGEAWAAQQRHQDQLQMWNDVNIRILRIAEEARGIVRVLRGVCPNCGWRHEAHTRRGIVEAEVTCECSASVTVHQI